MTPTLLGFVKLLKYINKNIKMKNHFSLSEIVRSSFLMKETLPNQIRKEEYPFHYNLNIRETDYPKEFERAGEFQISKIVGELIDFSFEKIFNIKPSKIIPKKIDSEIFNKKVPEVCVRTGRINGHYSIVIKNNGSKLTPIQIKNFEGDHLEITRALNQFEGRLEIHSGPSKTLYHIFIPTPLKNKIYY